MVDANYPPRLMQKVLAVEAPGGAPGEVYVVVPTIVAVGEPFKVKVAVLDADGYPSIECGGTVRISGDFSLSGSAEIVFSKGKPAVGWIDGVTIGKPGLYRFRAELDGTIWHSNPTCCQQSPRERIYWGDPHVHTVLSGCHADMCRSLNFCYAAARYMTGLDWVAAADHVSNGRCEFARWKEQCAVCNAHDDPPEFATLPAYVESLRGGCGGDNNVYLLTPPEMFVDEYEEGDAKTLCRSLAEVAPTSEFFVAPHHTTRTGKHGEIGDDIYPGECLMPVVEIHSKWGTSEYRGNPNPLQKIHPGPSYVVDLLSRGLKLGFIGGTDSHATMPSAKGVEPGHIDRLPGLTAVVASELSRESIFRGIQTRRCYATSLERVYLDVDFSGRRQGETVEWPDSAKPRRIRVTAAAKSDIVKIDIVRNGETACSRDIGGWQGSLEYTDEQDLARRRLESPYLGRFAYYYVRVTCASGAQAWSSPVWLILK